MMVDLLSLRATTAFFHVDDEAKDDDISLMSASSAVVD